jgi:hypothetical protein
VNPSRDIDTSSTTLPIANLLLALGAHEDRPETIPVVTTSDLVTIC